MATPSIMPTSLSQTGSGPSITVYPADLFTSTMTPNPNVTGGGTGVTANGQSMQTTANSTNVAFYTQIQMVPADTVLTGLTGLASGGFNTLYANPQTGSSIYFPLPYKINDIEMHLWNDLSFIDQMPVVNEIAKLIGMTSRAAGVPQSVNPFLYMYYKQPAFREFEFAWSFSPNNSAESQTLAKIINYIKTGALPAYTFGSGSTFTGATSAIPITLDYPYLALIRLAPSQFMFDIKPCAITSVNIDYTGSGHGPSFYNDGAPSIVNFTIGLKETAIQVRNDTAWRAGTLFPDFGGSAA